MKHTLGVKFRLCVIDSVTDNEWVLEHVSFMFQLSGSNRENASPGYNRLTFLENIHFSDLIKK